jgi:predicted dehydrogenase
VEKPLTTDPDDALELTELAEANDRVLLVGHIGAYNPAVRALREMVASGELGTIRYVDNVRVGLGMFHPNLNVAWDLAPHDLSIVLYVLDRRPVSVAMRGAACVQDGVEDLAYMTLMFDDGILAHSRLSWLDPRKTRRITVVGSEKMIVYDDLENLEKLKIYDQRVDSIRRTDTFGEHQFAYHYGSVMSPYIRFEEPLHVEALHFLECVRDRRRPLTDGRNGLEVVRVIAAAQRSLREGGTPVAIQRGDLRGSAGNASGVGTDPDGNSHAPSYTPILPPYVPPNQHLEHTLILPPYIPPNQHLEHSNGNGSVAPHEVGGNGKDERGARRVEA